MHTPDPQLSTSNETLLTLCIYDLMVTTTLLILAPTPNHLSSRLHSSTMTLLMPSYSLPVTPCYNLSPRYPSFPFRSFPSPIILYPPTPFLLLPRPSPNMLSYPIHRHLSSLFSYSYLESFFLSLFTSLPFHRTSPYALPLILELTHSSPSHLKKKSNRLYFVIL